MVTSSCGRNRPGSWFNSSRAMQPLSTVFKVRGLSVLCRLSPSAWRDGDLDGLYAGHPLGYPTLAASGLGHDIKVFMPVAKSACCLDHAERVMDKNTHTVRAPAPPHLPQTPRP
jgi:hypothetical protein